MIEELRVQIGTAQRNLALAHKAGLPYEETLHRARLDDLIDLAARHDVDITAWVDRALLCESALADG